MKTESKDRKRLGTHATSELFIVVSEIGTTGRSEGLSTDHETGGSEAEVLQFPKGCMIDRKLLYPGISISAKKGKHGSPKERRLSPYRNHGFSHSVTYEVSQENGK